MNGIISDSKYDFSSDNINIIALLYDESGSMEEHVYAMQKANRAFFDDFSKFEEKLDFYYNLDREDENFVSNSFRVDDTQFTTYILKYDEVFRFDTDVVESYVITCELYYTLTDVTLTISVVEIETNTTLFQMLNASVKEVL